MTSWDIIQLVLQFFRNEISFSSLKSPFRRWYEFKPTFFVIPRQPRNHKDAQAIYNSIRTYAFYLDALPIISDLGINLRIGLDDILAVPVVGDLITGLISVYQIWLATLLGPPRMVIYRMVRIALLVVLLMMFSSGSTSCLTFWLDWCPGSELSLTSYLKRTSAISI